MSTPATFKARSWLFAPGDSERKMSKATASPADIVIFDPEKKMRLSVETLHMKVDYNPYEGREVNGVTETVISRGRVIVDSGKFAGRVGGGSFLKRNARS